MTNNNNVIANIKSRIIKNKWIFIAMIYTLIYAYVIWLDSGAYMNANEMNWSIENQKHMNNYTLNSFIALALYGLLVNGWERRNKILIMLGFVLVLALFLTLPQLWFYQAIYAILIGVVIFRTPKKVVKKIRSYGLDQEV
jgi:hypothetical protein